MGNDLSGVQIGIVNYRLGDANLWVWEERGEPLAVDVDAVFYRVVLGKRQREAVAEDFQAPLHLKKGIRLSLQCVARATYLFVSGQRTRFRGLRQPQVARQLLHHPHGDLLAGGQPELFQDALPLFPASLHHKTQRRPFRVHASALAAFLQLRELTEREHRRDFRFRGAP